MAQPACTHLGECWLRTKTTDLIRVTYTPWRSPVSTASSGPAQVRLAKKPIYKRVWFWVVLVLVLLLVGIASCSALVVGGLAASSDPTATEPAVTASDEPAEEPTPADSAAPEESSPPAEDTAADLTTAQKNAARKAETYLALSGFSRQGLIDQLAFDDFSAEDATAAVDSLEIDYNEQAAKKAKTYLDLSGFSRQGLIDQLAFDDFTPEQAAAGADASGL